MSVAVSGKLTLGIEFAGSLHRDFSLSPLTLRLRMEAEAEALVVPDGMTAQEWTGLCRLAKRVCLGDLPRGALTGQQLLDIFEDDLADLLEAQGRLDERLASFRGAARSASDGDLRGGDADRVVGGGDPRHA